MMVAKGKILFVNCFFLPELVAKQYSSVKAIPQTSTSRQKNASQLNQFICYCQDPQEIKQTVICASLFCVIHEFPKSCTRSKKFFKSLLCVKKYSISRFEFSISVSSKFFVYPLNALQSFFARTLRPFVNVLSSPRLFARLSFVFTTFLSSHP